MEETSKFLFGVKPPNKSDRKTKCALDEIGRNSVKPELQIII